MCVCVSVLCCIVRTLRSAILNTPHSDENESDWITAMCLPSGVATGVLMKPTLSVTFISNLELLCEVWQ